MPSELLNNYILNNKAMAQTASLAQTSEKRINSTPKIETKSDSAVFHKEDNKKIAPKIIIGALFLGGGFILLAKKGKLGEGCKSFIDKIFKPHNKPAQTAAHNIETAAKNIQGAAEKAETSVKKYLPPEISPQGNSMQVQYNPKSIADDVADWAALHKSMPKETEYMHDGKHLPINREFTEFEIRPHHYIDDTDIFMCSRDYTNDFENYKIEDGLMKQIRGHVTDGIKKQSNIKNFSFQNGSGIETGSYDDGRKYVSFVIYNGEIVDTRPGYEIFTFVSRNNEFTQTQKDIIRIFEGIGDKKFGANIYTPLTFATITPNLRPDEIGQVHSNYHIIRRTNRNALLSAISSWAEHLSK